MLTSNEKALADEELVKLNKFLRGSYERGLCALNPVAAQLAVLQHRVFDESDDPKCSSKVLRGVERLIGNLAGLIESCEAEHPEESCEAGRIMVCQLLMPTLLGINAANNGFEIARGKDMQP
jgi:hypothetical protein